MAYWSFWMGGLALAGIALLHWLATGRLLAVSSRFSGLVDRLRGAADAEGCGPDERTSSHLAMFGGVIGGGFVAALVGGGFTTSFSPGVRFAELFGGSPLATALVLGAGGVLVGAGTRMARGCTSGHGLCGVARLERGSLVATAAFFGTGVLVSSLLGAVLG